MRGSVLALNRELAETQAAVRDIQARRRAEAELAETNRGILALYSELEDKAAALRRAGELKSRFLSNMSHEFRTPINAILSLSRLLLDGGDHELNSDQRTEVTFIRQSAQTLSDLVNDLLDLAKIEAGKTTVRRDEFAAAELFAACRGMMRPLLGRGPSTWSSTSRPASRPSAPTRAKSLRFSETSYPIAEIHRTRRGPGLGGDGRRVNRDLLGRRHRHRHRGGGPASRLRRVRPGRQPAPIAVQGDGAGPVALAQLAVLLGGEVSLTSRPGVGSTFRLRLPLDYAGPAEADIRSTPPEHVHESRYLPVASDTHAEPSVPAAILNVNDDDANRYALTRTLRKTGYRVEEADPPRRCAWSSRSGPTWWCSTSICRTSTASGSAGGSRRTRRPRRSRCSISAQYVMEEDRVHGLVSGADGYLIQPVEPPELIASIRGCSACAGPRTPPG